MSPHANGNSQNSSPGATLEALPKSNVFTQNLPSDRAFPTPSASHAAARSLVGTPRAVKDALYTFVRPDPTPDSELLAASPQAMRDIGLKEGEEETPEFRELVAGERVWGWEEVKAGPTGDKETAENGEAKSGGEMYPWAQCYGGWQFGNWASQLGDGRAISLFETTNPDTKTRYELQLKGAGRTPYSRFADGRAVLRSSIREFLVSEALNGLKIPTTRALSLTLLPQTTVYRERAEPGAIVARFAQSWIRIGTFDLLHARGDRSLIRQLAEYVAVHVYGGWDKLPPLDSEHNRFVQLFRAIVAANAKTVAAWQAYGFTNGVLNTDNTSILGLSLDFGPFAFLDNFDSDYTPNHDDHALRYSYRNQPTYIWWNLTRLGEALGELMGAGSDVDEAFFIERGTREEDSAAVIERAESAIEEAGSLYKHTFLEEYKRLMTHRLGLKTQVEEDFESLFSTLLDILQNAELDFSHFFRRLSSVRGSDVEHGQRRRETARRFLPKDGVAAVWVEEGEVLDRLSEWLTKWWERVKGDWGEGADADSGREEAMKAVNPNFVARGWVLDEIIRRVEKEGDRAVLGRAMKMVTEPFEETWNGDREEEERWCGDVPKVRRAMQCSCSS
ncbi:MAG: hypothetical protein M1814_005827 [Vezdaea aestivalis]|nr:MAG: hypothetical protein M1814_005827 [Vezdaea aestivalis]